MPSSTSVIFNPVARGDKARRFHAQLTALSSQCVLKPTLAPGDGRRLGAQAVREGFTTIVAAGGDGTINEVLNGIGDEEGGFARTRFAVLPLGTVNVFARELNLPTKLESAWRVIQAGREIQIDLPMAEFTRSGQAERRYFVQMAGAGFDARANELVNWALKKKIGMLAYIWAGLKALCGPMPRIQLTTPKGSESCQVVMIGNGRFYGGSFHLFPLADLQDGLLEVTLFPKVNWHAAARAGCGLLCKRIYSIGGAQHIKSETVTLSSIEPVPFHLDGENAGHLPVRFSVSRGLLKVLAP